MTHRSSIGAAAVTAALLMTSLAALAFDDAKYPDLSGQWVAVRLGVRGQPAFDPTKPWGLGQLAPLTPEYQKLLEQSADPVASSPEEKAANTRSEEARVSASPSASSADNAANPVGPTASCSDSAPGWRSSPPAGATHITEPCNSARRGTAGP